MSMSKKTILVISIFVSIFLFSLSVNAETTHKPCNTFGKEACQINRRCKWNEVESSCQDAYIAADPCSDKNILKVLNFFGYLLLIARVAVPLIIIVMGTFDIFKSVVDKDEKSLTKQTKTLLIRIGAGIFIFFLPTLIYALFSISSQLNIVEETKYKPCADCLLKATECNITTNN